jgi:hypothetical protein
VLLPTGGNGVDQVTYPHCPVPVAYNITVSDATQVVINNNTVKITPTGDMDDCLGKEYTVSMPTGSLVDTQGNNMTGIRSNTGGATAGDDARGLLPAASRAGPYKFFVPDATPPAIHSFSPSNNALNVPEGTNITIHYSEGIQLGAGNITITQVASPLTQKKIHEIIPASDSSRVRTDGKSMTINPSLDLIPGKAYEIALQQGLVVDLVVPAQNAGVASNPSVSLQGGNYTFIVLAKMRLQFTESIVLSAGSGQFVFVEANSGITTTIPATDASQVTFTGTGVILRPKLPTIASGREYILIVGEYVMMETTLGTHAGTVLDVYPDSPPFLLQFRPLLE